MKIGQIADNWAESARARPELFRPLEINILAGVTRGSKNLDDLRGALKELAGQADGHAEVVSHELYLLPEENPGVLADTVEGLHGVEGFLNSLKSGAREIIELLPQAELQEN